MSKHEVVRSWKSPRFRASLSPEQRAALPASPAGIVVIPETDLTTMDGACGWSMYECMSGDPTCIYTWVYEC